MSELADYADLLRRTLEAKSSRRRLSFELAAQTGNRQASEYRSLGKYLAGDEMPSRERAAILAVLLQEPNLAAIAEGRARQRRDRLQELAETVDDLQTTVETLLRRLEKLEHAPSTRRRASGAR